MFMLNFPNQKSHLLKYGGRFFRENGDKINSCYNDHICSFAIILVWGYCIAGAVSIQGVNNIIKNIMP